VLLHVVPTVRTEPHRPSLLVLLVQTLLITIGGLLLVSLLARASAMSESALLVGPLALGLLWLGLGWTGPQPPRAA
jgi:hypothetical protein